MLDKILDTLIILANRIPMSNKWYARLVCLPFVLWFLFVAPLGMICETVPDSKIAILVAVIALLTIWYFCREQKWLWILPYLCIGKILLALLMI